jgi:glyoxylase-like metal-dependent hydrolase (beta-lactamase superfamily II)
VTDGNGNASPRSWRIGGVKVSHIQETVVPVPITVLIPDATADALEPHRTWMSGGHLSGDDVMALSIAGFVVEAGGRRILVDTCIGPEHEHGTGEQAKGFLTNLASAGYDPASIDAVVCTHIHFDHVGWNTSIVGGERAPTFPNARYFITGGEWDSVRDETPDEMVYGSVDADVRFLVDLDAVDLVSPSYRLNDEVSLLPFPGHSPGHVAVLIDSLGERAIITGDTVHHPIQLAEPTWGSSVDGDPALAAKSRAKLVDYLLDTRSLVLGTHFATPTAGFVEMVDGSPRFLPVDSEP